MSFSPLIRQLIDALRTLPGVGQKTAQRMALQLLERDRSGGTRLAQALSQAMEGVGHCKQCRTLSEDEFCPQCTDPRRDDSLLCVVEGPLDVVGGAPIAVLDEDLHKACLGALQIARNPGPVTPRAFAESHSWRACTLQFLRNLAVEPDQD